MLNNQAIQDLKATDVFSEIVQIGIVVADMEKAKAGMKTIFGLEPDSESNNVYKQTWYRGEIIDACVQAAFYNFFNVQLEFLAPVGNGKSIWHDYLSEGFEKAGHALHHIRFDVENNDVATEVMKAAGVEKYMEGKSLVDPTATFTYYDSVDQVGFIIEAVTKPRAS
jgi:catechol 2,3-dioxygenase-like lactoylglutathione lyase family enzyme